MSKEKPCLRESNPGALTSKNAKDKRNSTTLLAMRYAKDSDDSNRRGSSCWSEKDSGYSDGSDWQQTDVEDQRSAKSRPRVTEHAEPPQSGQSKAHGNRNTGNPIVTPTKLAHPPAYVVKPVTAQGESQRHGGNNMRTSHDTVSSHVIIVNQPGFMPAALQFLKPLSQTSRVREKKSNSTYFPILNSYPRIAPHPTKKPPDKFSSKEESQNLSKRACTERKAEDASVTIGLLEEIHHKQPKLTVSPSVLSNTTSNRIGLSPSTSATSSTNPGPQSIPSLHTASSDAGDGGNHGKFLTSSHHRRFLNTVELLRQSGLLDITLRTKELLRQSDTTERDISQLRQHTELLCKAVSNPGNSLNAPSAWEQLRQAMAASGTYPDLEITQKSQNPSPVDKSSQCQSISLVNVTKTQAVDGRCLFTPSSEQSQVKQGKKCEARETSSGKVSGMFPDSSTG